MWRSFLWPCGLFLPRQRPPVLGCVPVISPGVCWLCWSCRRLVLLVLLVLVSLSSREELPRPAGPSGLAVAPLGASLRVQVTPGP